MALATAGGRGAPSVRFVLLKGADRRGFVFFTDGRSRGRASASSPRRSSSGRTGSTVCTSASSSCGRGRGGGGSSSSRDVYARDVRSRRRLIARLDQAVDVLTRLVRVVAAQNDRV